MDIHNPEAKSSCPTSSTHNLSLLANPLLLTLLRPTFRTSVCRSLSHIGVSSLFVRPGVNLITVLIHPHILPQPHSFPKDSLPLPSIISLPRLPPAAGGTIYSRIIYQKLCGTCHRQSCADILIMVPPFQITLEILII